MARTKNHAKTKLAKNQSPRPQQKIPFIEHVYELRKRLFYIAISVGIFSAAAYAIEHKIIAALLKPAGNQEFIYTSPGGGIDFLFRVCIYTGIVCSIPVIIYQLLRYIEPLIKDATKRMVFWGSLASGVLALAGIVFGYFVGLPSGLSFLLNQFHTGQITALITIQSYMSFVMMYMLGSAMLLQVPLVLLFINRIKPLKPSKLLSLSYQRWVILFAFISSAIINASPQIMAQLMVAVPIVLSYEVGIGIIWYANRRSTNPVAVQSLRQADEERRKERQAVRRSAVVVAAAPIAKKTPQPVIAMATPSKTAARSGRAPRQQPANRPRQYVTDFAPARRSIQYGSKVISSDGFITT